MKRATFGLPQHETFDACRRNPLSPAARKKGYLRVELVFVNMLDGSGRLRGKTPDELKYTNTVMQRENPDVMEAPEDIQRGELIWEERCVHRT